MSFFETIKNALVGEEGDLNPKLKPPPLLAVLISLIGTFCFILCMVSFHLGPVTLILCFSLVVLCGALATGEGSAWERGYPSTTLLIPISVGTALLPVYIGVKIFVGIYAPYTLAMTGRKYDDVSPTAKAAVYADAGIIRFSEDSALDTSRAFGYKGDDFTYCVAPVVSREAAVHPSSGGPKVSFWAVGKDCCGNRRDFECDGAGETETRNAFTVKELQKDWFTSLLVPKTSRPSYLKAVKAAKALHNLQSENDEQVILVRWAAEPTEILEVWHERAKLAVGLGCLFYAVGITLLWTGIHVYFDRDIQKLAKTKSKFGGGGAAPRQVRDPFMLGTQGHV